MSGAGDVDVKASLQAENGGGEFEAKEVLATQESTTRTSPSDRKGSKNKRFRRSPSKDDSFLKAALLRSKDRHQSRSGKGRGQPKKGGGGGKGTWGKPGSEIAAIVEDVADPNYDSDCQDGFVVQSSAPELTNKEFKALLTDAFLEYFENGDTQEVICTIRESNVAEGQTYLCITVLVNLALDRKATQRELASILLAELYGNLVGEAQYRTAFTSLLHDLPDLTIDIPNAPEFIGQFLARAIADDCLPPKFVENSLETMTGTEAVQALKKAHVLLNIAHGIVRLDNVWGIGGGIRPVKALIKQIVLLLDEYAASSRDVQEARRCLVELEVPHFHHELVYEAVVMVIESGKEQKAEALCTLLQHLASVAVLTPDQITQGFDRVLAQMGDILLDVPAAYTHLEEFAGRCHQAGFLPSAILKELPTRENRKRYVSEGDGGVLKNGN